ncbi:MAG: cell division ATP-binding protein FtsE [Candidatus Roizmanbacteria bacterium]|nr:cell division ATP-binding protein FtsE [Candidatus Roizmanbacteria bacterium]
MIQFSDVSKYFDNEAALADINLSVEKGELIYITGPSGAGKTTLLRLIYRAERPDAGSVVVGGMDVGKLKQGEIPSLRRNTGIVFQDFRLLTNKTVFENVALALRIHGIHPKEIKERVNEVFGDIGLKHKMHEFPQHLSGGEQQMVAIARAMVSKPTVLLADEPTGNLDPDTSTAIIKLFKEINVNGTTVVIATHHEALFKGTGRRVVYLKEGRIQKESTA